jgi:ankyrin repeat protein
MSANLSPETIKDFVIASHFNLEKVKTMLAENPTLLTAQHQWAEDDFEDGLGAASHVGSRPIAEFFLDKGAPLTICAAAMLGRADDVAAFLKANPALANARGAHGITVMFHAAMSGSLKVAELLRDHGCNQGFSYALHGAINYHHPEMVAWLLDNGANQLDVKDYQGKTLVQRAEEEHLPAVTDLLKQRGAVA